MLPAGSFIFRAILQINMMEKGEMSMDGSQADHRI